MQPSSLIFVVIAGVWAAFFIQYWIRRREHIATARSVDAFSETMRVLKVRDTGPSVDLDAPPRRSYSVSPARVVRPQVTVKRADTLLSRPLPEGADTPLSVEAWADTGLLIPDRATRGLTFVVGILGMLAFAALSLAGVLVPWAVAVPGLLAGGGFFWLRSAALAESREREAVRPARRRADVIAAHRGVAEGTAGPVEPSSGEGEIGGQARRDVAIHDHSRRPSDDAAATPLAPEPVAPSRPAVDDDDMPLTWEPRPVPKPMYAMKASATWVPVAEPTARAAAAPAPLADLDDDIPVSFPARRSAAG